MSFARGLVSGLVVAGAYVAVSRSGVAYGPFSLSRDVLPLVPVVGLPLFLVWGWTWVSDRWSGRSGPRMFAYTVALVFAIALAPLIARAATGGADVAALAALTPELLGGSVLFLLPAVAIAAALYWLIASRRLPARFVTLAIGYLVALPFALAYPPVAMGAVGGTAAGHAWLSPGARGGIAILVILLLCGALLWPALVALETGPLAPFPLPRVG